MRLRAVLVAIPALVGCGIVVKSFSVPYAELCDAGQCTNNHLPSLLNDVNYEVSSLVIVPAAGVTIAVLAVAVMILLSAPRVRTLAAWSLGLAAVVTFAFFCLLQNASSGRYGALIGIAGSLLVVIAGIGAIAAFTFPSRKADSAMTAR
jgi:hypothetical protein